MAERGIATRGLVVFGLSVVGIAVLTAIAYSPVLDVQKPSATSVAVATRSMSDHASPLTTDVSRPSSRSSPSSSGLVEQAGSAPVPVPTIAFDSSVHDYEVRYPDGWTLTPSTKDHDPDLLVGKGYRWTASATPVRKGITLEAFTVEHSPDACTAPWNVTEIDGRRALRRTGCGSVDADVIVGSTAYRFSLAGSGSFDSVLLFGRIASTIELPEPFASTVHDYTLSIPPAWDVEPSREPNTADQFYGPRHLRFTVAMHREAKRADVLEWAEAHFPRRSTGVVKYCTGRSSTLPVQASVFRATTLDGHPAAIRSSCGHVDAAVVVRDRIYELSLVSPDVEPGGDEATFGLLTRRIDVGTTGGGSPVWSGTFRSRLHGYVLHYPRDWEVSAASKAQSRDVLYTARTRTKLSITIGPKRGSRSLGAYADALFPHHLEGDGCQMGHTWIPAGAESFRPVKIAKHDAVVRTECDFIEAVVDLDDRALVLVFHSGKRMPGAEQSLFDKFIAGLQVTARS